MRQDKDARVLGSTGVAHDAHSPFRLQSALVEDVSRTLHRISEERGETSFSGEIDKYILKLYFVYQNVDIS